MKWIPFTIHYKIQPGKWTGNNSAEYYKLRKRFQIWRDMQKIASNIYDALLNLSPSIQLATPGSGQYRSNGGTDFGGLSGLSYGCAAVPQFGEKPALAMITGFFSSELVNEQPHPELERFHAGEILKGPAKHLYDSNPVTSVDDQVAMLKTLCEAAISTYAPNTFAKTFRIDFNGIVYGDRGLHFPLTIET